LALLDRAGLHGGEGVLLGLEDARRTAVLQAAVAGELDDAPVRREVAAQDREAAVGLERVVERADDLLAGRLLGGPGDVADGLAGDGDRALVEEAGVEQALGDKRDAAGVVEVGRDEAAARLEVAEQRG